MNATTIAGIAGGVVGLGVGTGLYLNGRSQPARAEQAARTEWNAWKQELDAEFPDRTLTQPGDEARFAAFLAKHPAPDWIRVEYKDLRQVSIDPFDPVGPPATMGGIPAVAGIGVGLVAGLGGAAMRYSSKASPAMQGVGAFGHVAGAVLGIGLIGASFALPKADGLLQEIESTEWHLPSKWYN